MAETYTLKENTILLSVRKLLKTLLETEVVSTILVPVRSEKNRSVMPALISDPEEIDNADPLSPCFQLNGAKLVSKLTKKASDERIAVFLRPCETRALIELVKIKQAKIDNLLIISSDCPGAFSNRDFNESAKEKGEEFTDEFLLSRIASSFLDDMGGKISTSCRICDNPFPDNADISINLLNSKDGNITIVANSEKGIQVLSGMDFNSKDDNSAESEERNNQTKKILDALQQNKKIVFEDLYQQTSTISGLSNYLSLCINCYNCRVACPVCFCKECVFNTDVFDYEPFQYAAWAKAKGALKMPGDTIFFHMTRMIHIGLSCVGCGQCSNACPNDIPLAELFKSVGEKAQKGFDYVPGKSVDDAPPLSIFFEDEFQDVTGIE
ncbi:MAG: Coenzyme F420 hydrogenase/dehydrogenase, beta subunit C-terminal domain [Thermodesulfobacteriota bacterium]|nr:Coenzyme F420 hydrogenase/dehydrogenase, beta subunit C-terminal domain [Thermodesulfobacteriota bacterium]